MNMVTVDRLVNRVSKANKVHLVSLEPVSLV